LSDDEQLEFALKEVSAQKEQPEVREWLSIRKEAGQRIDPQTAEVTWGYEQIMDPYRVALTLRRSDCIGRVYFAHTRDLLNLLGTIAEKGAGFKSLKDTWAETTTAHGRLMLTVLGGLAEFERELIRTRTGEGRERAKARGGSSWSETKADRPSAPGSPCSPGGRRGAYRDRSLL